VRDVVGTERRPEKPFGESSESELNLSISWLLLEATQLGSVISSRAAITPRPDELAFVHFTFATFELVMPIDRSSEFLFDDHLHMG